MYISDPAALSLYRRLSDSSTQDSTLCSSSTSNGSCVTEPKLHAQTLTTQVFSTENPAAMLVLGFAIFLLVLAAVICLYKKSKVFSVCFRRKCGSGSGAGLRGDDKDRAARVRDGGTVEVGQVLEVEPISPSLLMGERTPSSLLTPMDEKKGLDALEKGAVPVDVLQVRSSLYRFAPRFRHPSLRLLTVE